MKQQTVETSYHHIRISVIGFWIRSLHERVVGSVHPVVEPGSELSDTQEADITVNTVMLGPIYEENDPTEYPDTPVEEIHEQVPAEDDDRAATLVGRCGRSIDTAALLSFITAPESSFITGAVIPCDGGRLVSCKGKVVHQEHRIE